MSYRVRSARASELEQLRAVESAAAAAFAPWGLAEQFAAAPTPVEALEAARAAGDLLVASGEDDRAVGFALLGRVGGQPHLEELDVHPDHARRGVGRLLLEAVCAKAAAAGASCVTLSTMRDVPFNAPFYASAGFRILADDEISPELRALRTEEARRGLDVLPRVLMMRPLG